MVPEDPPMDRPIKVHHDEAATDWTTLAAVMERLTLAKVFLSHFHFKLFLLYFGDIQ